MKSFHILGLFASSHPKHHALNGNNALSTRSFRHSLSWWYWWVDEDSLPLACAFRWCAFCILCEFIPLPNREKAMALARLQAPTRFLETRALMTAFSFSCSSPPAWLQVACWQHYAEAFRIPWLVSLWTGEQAALRAQSMASAEYKQSL